MPIRAAAIPTFPAKNAGLETNPGGFLSTGFFAGSPEHGMENSEGD